MAQPANAVSAMLNGLIAADATVLSIALAADPDGIGLGGTFETEAPQTTRPPYITFKKVYELSKYLIGNRVAYVDLHYTIDVVFEGDSDKAAREIDSRIAELLVGQKPAVVGYTVMSILRVGQADAPEHSAGLVYRHAATTYRIKVTPQ